MSKKYHLLVLGCQMNKNDAERLATVLEQLEYQPTNNEAKADLIGVVACAVRQSAMDRIYGKLRKWQLEKTKRPLITLLSGCVLEHDRKRLRDKFDVFIDIKELESLPEQLKKIANDQLIDLPTYFKIQPKYSSQFQAYVPISTGCNKFCTYCAVPYTRGKEISRPSKEILEEITHLIQHGYKEIILVGQNVNSYGLDLKSELKFHQLLHKIDLIKGDYWLRFVTSHPYDMSDELIEELASSKHLTNYLHLPVQSGDDEMLKKMNRHYTIKHYTERITKIRAVKPNIALSTDVIVGFSGETEKQFQSTMNLVRALKYDMAYISQYSLRQGTAGAKLYKDDIPKEVKKKREKILTTELAKHALNYNKKFVGKTIKVLVEAPKLKGKKFIAKGKTSESKTVTFSTDSDLQGQFVKVKIDKALAWALQGTLIKKDEQSKTKANKSRKKRKA